VSIDGRLSSREIGSSTLSRSSQGDREIYLADHHREIREIREILSRKTNLPDLPISLLNSPDLLPSP
jgi:hypothetical protein